ncbi:MAG TPA: MFS transporter [Gaiellales bacterium]|jgi:EmrB/QacA subfamily drug resistance transporter
MTKDHPNHKWWTLFAMCFALFMIMLDNTVVNVALPTIQRSLHISNPENLEWTVNAYVLTFAALILLGGKLGDRFGRKRIFILGLAIFTVSSAACALATTDTQLIVFRALQGVGGAFLNPLSLSILVAAFPRKQLPTAIGIWAGISGLGLAIGPLLGGFLTENVSWSAVFWINVPIGILAAAVAVWAVAESSDTTTRSLDLPGVVLVTGGLFTLTWALIKTSSHSWTGPYTLGFLALTVALLGGFIWRERTTAEPMLPMRFFSSRVFSASSTVVLFVGFAMFGIFYFVTLYFQNVLGYSALEAGVRSLPMTMMVIFVAPIAGRLSGKIQPRFQMTVGMLMMTAGLLELSRLDVNSSYNMIWPAYIIAGAGIAMTMPAVSAAGMAAVDQAKAGVASGVINASRQVGGALGVAVLGAVVSVRVSNVWTHGDQLVPLVTGGQGAKIHAAALQAHMSPQAAAALQAEALRAFVHGVQGAMLVGAVFSFAAAMTAFFGLRHAPIAQHAGDQAPVMVEA